jgi:hypothetical protein
MTDDDTIEHVRNYAGIRDACGIGRLRGRRAGLTGFLLVFTGLYDGQSTATVPRGRRQARNSRYS